MGNYLTLTLTYHQHSIWKIVLAEHPLHLFFKNFLGYMQWFNMQILMEQRAVSTAAASPKGTSNIYFLLRLSPIL